MRLRKRFFDRYVSRNPEFVRFVFVDTDAQTFVPQNKQVDAYLSVYPEENEKVVCPITKDQYEQTFRKLADKVDSDHLDWLKLDLRTIGHKSLEHGAGTHRQFGRLAFFLNYRAIRRTTEEQIKQVLKHASSHSTEGRVGSDRGRPDRHLRSRGAPAARMFIDPAATAGRRISSIGRITSASSARASRSSPTCPRCSRTSRASCRRSGRIATPRCSSSSTTARRGPATKCSSASSRGGWASRGGRRGSRPEMGRRHGDPTRLAPAADHLLPGG